MYWFPKTKIGKIALYVTIAGFVLIFLQYWIGMVIYAGVTEETVRWEFIVPGFLAMACVLAGGVCAVLSLTKYKDRAILLFVPALIGLLGLLFLVGELIFPH